MNTTAKGDRFEEEIFQYFKSQIDSRLFIAGPDHCRIYKQKALYSKDRESDIAFDVVIEIYMPESSSPAVFFIIECKNYGGSVPVSDVEEFFAKVQQVAPANVKAVFATTSNFQEGAYNFARSKGIGLLRKLRLTDYKWDLYRSVSSTAVKTPASQVYEVYKGLIDESYRSRYYDLCISDGELLTNSLRHFCLNAIGNLASIDPRIAKIELEPEPDNSVSYLGQGEIEASCRKELRKCEYRQGVVPLERLCEALKAELGLNLVMVAPPVNDAQENRTLGRILFKPLEIVLIQDEHRARQRFTLAHELGHLLLGHGKYMSGEQCEDNDVDLDTDVKPFMPTNDIARLEWQANQFAAMLLLPENNLRATAANLLATYGLGGRPYLYVDDQPCNRSVYRSFMRELINTYEVSHAALRLRLETLGLLKLSLNLRSSRQVLEKTLTALDQ